MHQTPGYLPAALRLMKCSPLTDTVGSAAQYDVPRSVMIAALSLHMLTAIPC
jgi:hypothetical protein